MFQPKLQLIFLLLIFSQALAKVYQCSVTNSGKDCDFNGLELTRTDYKIEPRASYPAEILKFYFLSNSVVPVLSSGICEAFPNLNSFYAHSSNIEEIEDYAFEGCAKVSYLTLNGNKITKIGEKAFKGLVSLENLYISGGNISEISFDMTDMKKLKNLQLLNMSITHIEPKIFQSQVNLEKLILHSNLLFDLEIEEILKFTPYLKEIQLEDNNFKCSRVPAIVSVLRMKNIKVNTEVYNEPRQRAYKPNIVEEISCLSDHQWALEVFFTFKNVDKVFKMLQTFPLVQFINKKLMNIENNSAKIENLTISNQNLQENLKVDVSTLESKLDDNEQKNNETQIEINENFGLEVKHLHEKFEHLEKAYNEYAHHSAQSTEEKFKNLSETIESLKIEVDQKEKKSIENDNAHDNHKIALWTFIFIILVAIMAFVAYFVKLRRASSGSGNAVYFTNESSRRSV